MLTIYRHCYAESSNNEYDEHSFKTISKLKTSPLVMFSSTSHRLFFHANIKHLNVPQVQSLCISCSTLVVKSIMPSLMNMESDSHFSNC